jgi:pilus assembly protein FimV
MMAKIKSSVVDDGLWKMLAGFGAVILAGLGLMVVRRRRADEEYEISMLSIETQSQSADDSNMPSSIVPIEEKSPDRETSFLTVYSDSDAVVQADEVDPIAEADVYIAYGRDEQAEEVLLDGVATKPERVDIKQKLLALYHKNSNAEGFERIAEELYSQKNLLTSKVWQEVSLMGADLSPDNPLFAVSSAEMLPDELSEADASVNARDSIDADSTANDGVYQIDPLDNEPDQDSMSDSMVEPASVNLIDFEDGRSELSEIDNVDIGELDSDSNSTSDDIEDLSGMIGLDEGESVLEDDAPIADYEPSEMIDFNESEDEGDSGDLAESKVVGHDVSDLEIDEDYDEARTKYELAKVFVDLGDEDGAKKILDELLSDSETGDDVVQEAKVLLESLQT